MQNYSEYLQLQKLLATQKCLSKEHDEMLFIIIHQTYELWFKQILHEMGKVQNNLESNKYYDALHTLVRILKIMKTLVMQIDILETMTPISFNSFREKLDTSSGFQSIQFRKLEFMLGKKSEKSLEFCKSDPDYQALEDCYKKRTVLDSLFLYLNAQEGVSLPQEVLNRDVTQVYEENKEVQNILKNIYKTHGAIRILCDHFLDLDEGLQEWRYRHVKMIERTIGDKKGTGGSSGVDYLKRTLFQHLFKDLWAIRNEF